MTLGLQHILEYPHYTDVTMRFSDQDSAGHINNVAYAAFLEAGRIDFLYQNVSASATAIILAHIAIDYIRETHYPGVVRVGNALESIGTKSITTCHGMFVDGELHSTGRCVLVCLDTATRAPTAVTQEIRDALQKYQLNS